MSNLLYNELQDIIKHIKIKSSADFYFKDRFYTNDLFDWQQQQKDEQKDDQKQSNENIVPDQLRLEDLLYRVYHCRNASSVQANTTISFTSLYNEIRDFIGELSKANTGTGTWENGWEICRIEKDGQIAVRKNGLMLWVTTKQFMPNRHNRSLAKVGTIGQIVMTREYQRLLPGFYMANSNAPVNTEYQTITVRIYFNIHKEGASLLMRLITAELNGKTIPFHFKILNDPSLYPRADAAVLYIHKTYFNIIKNKTLPEIYPKVKDFINPSTPLFAKRLAPGLSLAEDPDNGESFGYHRSRLLAEAIREYNNDRQDLAKSDSIEYISSYFETKGLDLNYSYLRNNKSVDDYEILKND